MKKPLHQSKLVASPTQTAFSTSRAGNANVSHLLQRKPWDESVADYVRCRWDYRSG